MRIQATPASKQASRRSFLTRSSLVGAASLLPVTSLLRSALADSPEANAAVAGFQPLDYSILKVASTAEALAVTMYTHIIDDAKFFTNLPATDQGYFTAAREEEMSHYLLETSVTGHPSPYNHFYFPEKMFKDAQTTLDVLVTLEEAFIAAYLVGVRNFSTPDLRVTAARIMGIESDHRTLARVAGPDVAAADGGPINKITGVQGVAEESSPADNNGYERTLGWTELNQVTTALLPFVDPRYANKVGFDSTNPYKFVAFEPTLPTDLGAFISFTG